MALVHDGLWGIVNGSERAPSVEEADHLAKFVARRDRALATIVLTVEPSLLYLIGDPEDPVVEITESIPKENLGKQVSFATKTSLLTAERWGFSPRPHQSHDRTV